MNKKILSFILVGILSLALVSSYKSDSIICNLTEEMCSGDNVYVCIGEAGWKHKEICPEGCLEGKCIIGLTKEEIYKPVPNTTKLPRDNSLKLKDLFSILIGIALLVGLSILYFKVIKKKEKKE